MAATAPTFKNFAITPRVFSMPELFDQIIHYLPIANIIRLRRVSTEWYMYIDRGNFTRKATFLASATEGEAKKFDGYITIAGTGNIPANPKPSQLEHSEDSPPPTTYTINPHLFESDGGRTFSGKASGNFTLNPRFPMLRQDVRSNMFYTQPPVTVVSFGYMTVEDCIGTWHDLEIRNEEGVRFKDLGRKIDMIAAADLEDPWRVRIYSEEACIGED